MPPATAAAVEGAAELGVVPDRLFADLGQVWPQFDGVVHSIGFAPREAIAGGFLESFVACQLRPEVDRFRGSLHHLRWHADTWQLITSNATGHLGELDLRC